MTSFFRKISEVEGKIRGFLKKYPAVFTILAAVSIILFWEGVVKVAGGYNLSGPVLIFISAPILALLGVFIPFFINDKNLVSELRHEEKTVEKVEHEERQEEKILAEISEKVHEMDSEIHEIQKKMHIRE